ncbi:MAG: hypothetical protein JF628_11630 [Sphingomonas sp.]|nr:hypothetical protein [Sphingomonas sp.]
MSNPYEGTPNAGDWESGFRAGLVVPDRTVSAPLVLAPDALVAYNDGVLVGQLANAALLPVEHVETVPDQAAEYVHYGMDFGGPIIGKFLEEWSGALTKEALKDAWTKYSIKAVGTELAFNAIMLVSIWGPNRDNFFSDIVAARLSEVQAAIATGDSANSNLELFMALADPTGVGGMGADPLGANGIWHAPFRLTFQEAQQDALAYPDPPSVYIHRYQTSQPDVVDVLRP